MAAKIKFFVTNTTGKTKTEKKVIEVNILVHFTNGRQFNLKAKSGKQIKPEYWNNKAGKVRDKVNFIDSDNLQNKLDKLNDFIINEFKETPDKTTISKDWLDKTIDKHYNPDKYLQNDTLFGFIQHFIDNSTKRVNQDTGNPVCYKMRREYQVTFNYLKDYAKEFKQPDFIDMDLEFYENFVSFLRKKGLAVNTIGKKVQTVKVFLNDATEKGINPYQKYKSRKFKNLTEESDNIYLTKDELKQFYEFDFSSRPGLEKVKDLFIVGCWTGVRFSDLQQITTDKIKGNLIYLKQKKTGGKVIIPVRNEVKEILSKYNGVLPKPISNQKYNDYLKEAATIAGINSVFIKTSSEKGFTIERKYKKCELISSHAARRSFCTNAYKDNIPTLSIMAISGHKTEKAFLKYIKVEPEEHAKKVLQMWQNNGEFMNVAK